MGRCLVRFIRLFSVSTRRHRTPAVLWRRIALFAGTLMFCISLTASPTQAILFGKFGVKDELELGRKFKVLVKSRMPIIEDPEVVNYIQGIIDKLKTGIPPQPFEFETSVIRANSLNAFAVPGGYVFVHSGLLLGLEHEAELAGVLAHEMAHVTQRHIASRIEKGQKVQLLSLLGLVAGIAAGGDTGSALLFGSVAAGQSAMLDYSRQDEREADQIGLIFLTKGGYNPSGMIGGFEKISAKHWHSGHSIPAYLSTHPNVDERIIYLRGRVKNLPANIQNRPYEDKKFRRIQTLVRARYTDPKVALQYFGKAGSEKSALNYMGKGITLSRLNRVKEANAAFDKALALAPNDSLIVREAGRFQFSKGDSVKAAMLLQKAVLLNPRDLMGLFFYARILEEQGNTQNAISTYQELVEQLPEDAEVREFFGRALGKNGYLFDGHLQLAYGALYKNNSKRTDYFFGKAQALAKTPEEKKRIEEFKKRHDERKEFWNL